MQNIEQIRICGPGKNIKTMTKYTRELWHSSAVESPNFGCPTSTDSCPGDCQCANLIGNFMDYIDDSYNI